MTIDDQSLWQVIYDAAANEGCFLHDDTVSAIEAGVSKLFAAGGSPHAPHPPESFVEAVRRVRDKMIVYLCDEDRTDSDEALFRELCEDMLPKWSDELLDALNLVNAVAPDGLLAAFDLSVAGVHLLDGPRPSYEFYDKAEWHTRGIRAGLKIARTILVENLALLAAARPRRPRQNWAM